MQLLESLKEHSEELGDGISPVAISDLEARLDIALPDDFKEYLKAYNYAEIFGDPIYSINPELEDVDLYTQNKNKEHLRHGFLEVFANDIDGTIYMHYKNIIDANHKKEFTSDKVCVSKEVLKEILKSKNFFKP